MIQVARATICTCLQTLLTIDKQQRGAPGQQGGERVCLHFIQDEALQNGLPDVSREMSKAGVAIIGHHGASLLSVLRNTSTLRAHTLVFHSESFSCERSPSSPAAVARLTSTRLLALKASPVAIPVWLATCISGHLHLWSMESYHHRAAPAQSAAARGAGRITGYRRPHHELGHLPTPLIFNND